MIYQSLEVKLKPVLSYTTRVRQMGVLNDSFDTLLLKKKKTLSYTEMEWNYKNIILHIYIMGSLKNVNSSKANGIS